MSARAPSQEQLAAHNRQLFALALTAAGFAAVALAAAWLAPVAIGWIHSGRAPHLTVRDAFAAIGTGRLLSGDPAAAYPPAVRGLLPGGWGYWTTLALLIALPVAVLTAVTREAWVRMSRPAADRRWWQLRGRRPHEFGRYATVRALAVEHAQAGRHVVGRFARPAALIATEPDVQIAAIAAPRTGKTTGIVEPFLLEHAGPAVATSTKTVPVRVTAARRRRLGETWVWEQFGPETDAWDPLQGCQDWGHALLMARWLGHARRLGQASSQEYFDAEAEGLTAPLVHAAAHTPDKTIVDVYKWILARERDDPSGSSVRSMPATRSDGCRTSTPTPTASATASSVPRRSSSTPTGTPPPPARRAATAASPPSGCSTTGPPTRSTSSPGASTNGCSRRWLSR